MPVIGRHKASQNADSSATHNLEVPGSSPGWSTLKIKHLRFFCKCFFFNLRTPCEHRILGQTLYIDYFSLRTRFWCSQSIISQLSFYHLFLSLKRLTEKHIIKRTYICTLNRHKLYTRSVYMIFKQIHLC